MIEDAFKDWIFKDRERRESLVALYNEKFNCIRPREYDGSHIQFFGMNPEIVLRPHQRNAIAHILYGHNTLLAHTVGAGKTYEMVAAAMEKKRLGLCSKTLVAVPNHLTGQFASEALKLYPNANILVTTQRDFEKSNRKRFCAKIATDNYDIVVIGHSQFEKIPLSDARKAEFIRKQIDELEMQLESMDNSDSRLTVKQLESKKKQLKTKLSNLLDAPKRDDVVTFEELGADSLMVDEAHNFKNLMTVTKMHNIAGISTTESQKASDLFMKCQYLDEITGARGVTFATGTPISNSMTELYTMQRYLQQYTLERNGLANFDSWAATFGETVTAIELAPEGTGYRTKTRFARFFNLPELMAMFKECADIQTADMLYLRFTKARFYVVDPENEYAPLVQELGGEVVNISVDSATHFNPLDFKYDKATKIPPHVAKAEFVLSLCEQIMGKEHILAGDKSLIDDALENIYKPLMESHYTAPCPTIKDLWMALNNQRDKRSKEIALALRIFATGSMQAFAQPTNVDMSNRLICFNIQSLGEQLKPVAMLSMLEYINTAVMSNERNDPKAATWVYFDEIYLLLRDSLSANFLYTSWKRFRKYNAYATGITQNVQDCLTNDTAYAMLANSEFVVMLRQTKDIDSVVELYGLSEPQRKYLLLAQPGEGIIKMGNSLIPFNNPQPKDTKTYKLLTTKPGEME